MKASHRSEIIYGPAALQAMQRGIDELARAIQPTLGPYPRLVALARDLDKKLPELLDDGGLIARRIIQLSDRDADMGAMLLRQLLWKLREEVGDGTATAAVLFQSIFAQSVRFVTAGADAMLLRGHLERLVPILLETLDSISICVEGQEMLAQVAESICYDPPLAHLMGEIFDIIGEYGHLEIRPGRSRILEREYIEGMYWNTGVLVREMLPDRNKIELENAALLITDLELMDPRMLMPLIERTLRSDISKLMIVAKRLSPSVTAFLRAASQKPDRFQVVAVKTPGLDAHSQFSALQDLAILTGGMPIIQASGQSLEQVTLENLGRARRAWADVDFFGIIGGKGDPRRLRKHLAGLRATFGDSVRPPARSDLEMRIGKLMGGAATLWVGDVTETAIKQRVERATRTTASLRAAKRDGVVPGGGTALLDCRDALERCLPDIKDDVERAAYIIVISALDRPLRVLLANRGFDDRKAGSILAQIANSGPQYGCDLRTGQVVPMMETGVYDSAGVIKAVLARTIRAAALALTVSALVHTKNPATATEP